MCSVRGWPRQCRQHNSGKSRHLYGQALPARQPQAQPSRKPQSRKVTWRVSRGQSDTVQCHTWAPGWAGTDTGACESL